MSERAFPLAEITDIELNASLETTLYEQLYHAIKQRICQGRFKAGMRLPASRKLAEQLSVSRNTITLALEQLQAEGYLISRVGSGFYITTDLPETFFKVKQPKVAAIKPLLGKSYLAASVNKFMQPSTNRDLSNYPFQPGMPDLKHFPKKIWSRIAQRYHHLHDTHLLAFDDPRGYLPLREVLSEYLTSSRSVRCQPQQIILTAGAQQALNLVSHVLINPNDIVAIENPGYIQARRIFELHAAKLRGIDIQKDSLCIKQLQRLKLPPKLIYTTPTHQYPLGMIMPLAKRIQLIEYCKQQHCWLLEDDYDSEYYYQAKPIPCLQGLADSNNILYMGSFSKVLFPALRLGYLVVPESFVDTFTQVKACLYGHDVLINQAIVAEFMSAGHFGRHLKKMRLLYADKLNYVKLLHQRYLEKYSELLEYDAGMHLVIKFKHAIDDNVIVSQLREKKFAPTALSNYFIGKDKQSGLVLGFANSDEKMIEIGIKLIRKLIMSQI